jgi:BirA family biotin operon repressor/biotin-[acetyl-CoA-carboxylase] ligase
MPVKVNSIVTIEGKPYTIYRFDILDSTNTFLKKNSDTLPDYTVILTDNQTAGRGRFSRIWSSAANKDCTFSLLVPLAPLAIPFWQNIPQIAALAITEVLADYGIFAAIKWPNDVLVAGKKICGILCETITSAHRPCAILGIGLNVNSSAEHHTMITQPVTSLSLELHKEIDTEALVPHVLDTVLAAFTTLSTKGFDGFIDDFSRLLMYKNEIQTIIDGQRRYVGRIQGINSDGTLIFNLENGTTLSLHTGEVTFKGE